MIGLKQNFIHNYLIDKHNYPIDNYDWTEIEFPAHSKDWIKFECNNKTIAINVLYMPYNDRQEVNDEENKENKENKFDDTKYIRNVILK